MKCPVCGSELFPNYKARTNNWKCPNCKRWFISGKSEKIARTKKREKGKARKEALPGRESGNTGRRNKRKECNENMAWKEKVAGKISFEEVGQEIIGKITDIKDQPMPGGTSVNAYTMVTEEGELINFLGTTVLDRLIGHEEGSLVKIRYLGMTKTGSNRNLKNFHVEIWEESEEPVSPVAKPKAKK